MSKKENFGQFLSKLASAETSSATKATLKGIQERLERQRQEALEKKLLGVYEMMQQQVSDLRAIRRREAGVLANIKRLEQQAQDLVDGKEEPTPF